MKSKQNSSPRLDIQMSWWAMSGLFGDMSIEEKFERISQAGYTGVFARLTESDQSDQWIKLLEKYSFSYGVQSFPKSADEIRKLIIRAKAMGASYLNAQVADYYVKADSVRNRW
ncbi:hypothetical protein ACFQZR_13820 [Paenibacillus sp. GCM10027629]|uniref:hypothetical protein n=1 Tax=Paenibacillus sp. GCM10027629 TaxID=3273414 RepID=UPI00362D2091